LLIKMAICRRCCCSLRGQRRCSAVAATGWPPYHRRWHRCLRASSPGQSSHLRGEPWPRSAMRLSRTVGAGALASAGRHGAHTHGAGSGGLGKFLIGHG
jgi:hypothetical protein